MKSDPRLQGLAALEREAAEDCARCTAEGHEWLRRSNAEAHRRLDEVDGAALERVRKSVALVRERIDATLRK
jgi:hypothetical protein